MQCKQLEHLEHEIEYQVKPNFSFITWLIDCYQTFLNIGFDSQKLKVWQKSDRQGHTYWKVYNPTTHQTMYFSSEEEVRIWIDRSYYQ